VRLVFPFVDELTPLDVRLLCLAEFLGADCEKLALPRSITGYSSFFDKKLTNPSCCVVNPEVMQRWIGGDEFPLTLACMLLGRCSSVLVHAPRSGQFDASLISALSQGQLAAARSLEKPGESYHCNDGCKDFCEAFSGLSVGIARPGVDRVFLLDKPGSRGLLSIGDQVYVVSVKSTGAKVIFLGTHEIADLHEEMGEESVNAFFSLLLPQAMAIRAIIGDEAWRPATESASLVVDDPVLRENYGFLNFNALLTLMKQQRFHTSLAFIPHNFRRSSNAVIKMFRENPENLSLCFHGNDHTNAEFASKDEVLLHTLVATAEERVRFHQAKSGLRCDKVMVFPQGKFSLQAMDVLRSRNFDAAVNTVAHPTGENIRLKLEEVCQPAVMRYSNFSLFSRRSIEHCRPEDIAFDLFFGKPALIVEHHQIFKSPQPLLDVIARINSVSPAIHWVGLGQAVRKANLQRRTSNGTHMVRAYSNIVEVENLSDQPVQVSVEWQSVNPKEVLECKVGDTVTQHECAVGKKGVRARIELPSYTSQVVSVLQRNNYPDPVALGLKWKAKAFLRRRLSEIRDDYLSKNAPLLTLAKTLQRLVAH
jgi:hypothetical protein